jgi:hypothetical protein
LEGAEVARQMGVSAGTVANHNTDLGRRIGGGQAPQWLAVCHHHGWLELPELPVVTAYRQLPPDTPGIPEAELAVMGYKQTEIAGLAGLTPVQVRYRRKLLCRLLGTNKPVAIAAAVSVVDRLNMWEWFNQLLHPRQPMCREAKPTEREATVLAQYALGWPAHEVAERLGLTVDAVRTYARALRTKAPDQDWLGQITTAIRDGQLPCPVSELGAVIRFSQLYLSPVENRVVELLKQGLGNPAYVGENASTRGNRLNSILKKLDAPPRLFKARYIAALALWSEVGLGWTAADEQAGADWLYELGGFKSENPAYSDQPLLEQLKAAPGRHDALLALASGSHPIDIAQKLGWTGPDAEAKVHRFITRGRNITYAQAMIEEIQTGKLVAPASLQEHIQTVAALRLNDSERKVLHALIVTHDPFAVAKQLRLPLRFITLHMEQLKLKLGAETLPQLAALARWSGQIKHTGAPARRPSA